MNTFIKTGNGEEIKIYNATLSTGDSLEIDSRFSHDASKTSQTITRRRRNTALEATLRISVSFSELASDGVSIFDYIADVAALCKTRISLYWYGREYSGLLVKSVQITPEMDAVTVFSGVQIALSLVEGFVAKKTAEVKVKNLNDPEPNYTPMDMNQSRL